MPKAGAILMCDYPSCFVPPEMVKTRPVIVVGPALPGRSDLVTVVPISGSSPKVIFDYHCELPADVLPTFMRLDGKPRWAKCDMVNTLSLARLHPVQGPRDAKTRKRSYEYLFLPASLLDRVRWGVARSLGISVD
ncbi:MAG: type II toxin-antitoxin system PemK/MazF family toxin [Luteibacter sp.]